MTYVEQKQFINEHLYNELRWLLCAAASWKKVVERGTETYPMHFIVYGMDSAFLHARALFEFFTYTQSNSKQRKYKVIWKDFGLKEPLISSFYKDWMLPLHHHLMHLENRLDITNIINSKHLKDMVFDFAQEIVRLWRDFSSKVDTRLKPELDIKLEDAIIEAERIMPQIRDSLPPRLISRKLRVK